MVLLCFSMLLALGCAIFFVGLLFYVRLWGMIWGLVNMCRAEMILRVGSPVSGGCLHGNITSDLRTEGPHTQNAAALVSLYAESAAAEARY